MAPQPERDSQEIVQARALMSGLTALSSRAGHDLLGPLNQAGSLVALFIKRFGNSADPEAEQVLQLLQSASNRMEGAVAGVRKFMEIAGKPLNPTAVDLNLALASCLTSLDRAITASGAQVVSEDLPVAITDAAQTTALFEILIGNAIKFSDPAKPVRIEISSGRSGDEYLISVIDNGIGMDPEYMEDVFLPFRRLNGREYPGAGLGLSMAKLIAEMHGCRIWIDAVPSGGTCVRFTVRPGPPVSGSDR